MSDGPEPAAPVDLLYEDEALVVVDKPAGVPVIPAPGAPGCVRDRVAAQVGARLWVVHRLDRETSGALAFARTAAAHRSLCMAFEQRLVEKTYVALVRGVPDPVRGDVDIPLHAARKGKMRPAAPGESMAVPARTHYHMTRQWHRDGVDISRLTAQPLTGRQHQIRVHLRALGTPILRDAVYGGREPEALARLPIGRLALHAEGLVLPHPSGPRDVRVRAPEPRDFLAVIRTLDESWSSVA
jgi:tRNA pseudouridine32 synthase/23S rRNA pseudouridine746 synthase